VCSSDLIVLFLGVVLPVFSRDETNFREENLHTNLSQLNRQVGAYHRAYGGFPLGFQSGEPFEARITIPADSVGFASPDGVLPLHQLVVAVPRHEIGKIR